METNNNHFKGFTLVELIIVITILAILSTIAFISFQNYTKSARDSVRLASIKNVMGGLEISNIKTGKYPQPDNGQILNGNTGSYIIQGKIGNNVKNLIGLQNDLKDPLDGKSYVYSIFKDGKYYQIGTNREETQTSYIKNTYASNLGVMLDGNYQFDPSLPSLITITGSVNTNSGIFDPSVCFVINNGENTLNSTSVNCKKKSEMSLKNYDNSLVGYWDMETTSGGLLKDLSGNGNNGSFSGGMSYSTSLTGGIIGKGLSFDGINNYIDIPNNSTFQVKELTINFIGQIKTGGEKVAISYFKNANPFFGYWTGIGRNNGYVSCLGDSIILNQYCREVGIHPIDGNYYFITFTYNNSSGNWNFYINGSLQYYRGRKVDLTYNNVNNFWIGSGQWGNGTNTWSGVLDEIKVYNRALSDQEILQQARIAGF